MPIVKALSEKQKAFVDRYLVKMDATNAYRDVYGDCKTAGSSAYNLLGKPEVQAYVQKRFAELAKERGLEIQDVLDGLTNVAFLDIRKVVDEETGELLPLDKLPDAVATAIGGVKVTERWVGKGEDAQRVVSYEYKLTDRNPALTNLGRYFKMFVDVQQHEHKIGLADRLAEARAKRKARQEAQA
jgi:phage terminase small subunit